MMAFCGQEELSHSRSVAQTAEGKLTRMNGLDKNEKVAPLDNGATSVIATEGKVLSWRSSDSSGKKNCFDSTNQTKET